MNATLCQPTITVIQHQGHLHAATANEFQDRLISAISSHPNAILLVDMAQVESLDSSGLMTLVVGLKRSRDRGCRLSLCSLSPAVQLVFEITQLDRVFEIFDDRAAFQAELG